jgi:hypothetical protein
MSDASSGTVRPAADAKSSEAEHRTTCDHVDCGGRSCVDSADALVYTSEAAWCVHPGFDFQADHVSPVCDNIPDKAASDAPMAFLAKITAIRALA